MRLEGTLYLTHKCGSRDVSLRKEGRPPCATADYIANKTLKGKLSIVYKKETRKLFITVGGFREGI